ncbi:MAG: DNA polymerase I [Lachnospiraceae bacterium]|nr:DNA polymerase I [Lachnospiraceae bacterium]
MEKKIVLIDGHSLMFRAFYGMPPAMTAPDGTHTNAIYGFLAILFKILGDEKPDYLAVAFDTAAPTFRHEKYEAYKGTRQKAPDEFHEQIPLIKEVLDAMGIAHMELPGWEADDILGTLAGIYERKGAEVLLISGDRDLLQIATDRIRIVIPKTRGGQTTYESYLAADVEKAMGVTPKEFIDMKALMGDSSDNIPGLPGVGPKTASAIIARYHSIENAYEHREEISPKKARTAMEEHYDLAVLSKDLAAIRTDAPVNADEAALSLGNIYNEKTYEIFRRLGFKSFLSRFENENKAAAEVLDIKEVSDLREAEKLFERAGEEEEIGLGLVWEKGRLFAVGIAFADHYAAMLSGRFLTQERLLHKLALLCGKEKKIAAANAKELCRALPSEVQSELFDPIVAAYLIDPLKSDWTYDAVAAGYSNLRVQSEEELIGKKGPAAYLADLAKQAKKEGLTEEKLSEQVDRSFIRLAGMKAAAALKSRQPLRERLAREGMEELFDKVEMPLVRVLSSMEKEGILASRKALKDYSAMLDSRIQELTKEIYEEAGEEFNINSPKQLGHILFEKMKLPGSKKTKTGYSTAADVLEKLAEEHRIVANILEYRTFSKLKSTYADGLQDCIEEDGRIRTTFNQTITATGRLSSTDPNLQNIPMREELGRKIRKCFYPAEGCVFVDADYSQIELRILAHMSGDEKLIEAYREARDIHRTTASQVFHVPFDEVTDLMRRNAKAVNFGIVYGISSFGLSQGLSISRKEAQAYINDYFATYPKIREFLDGLVAFAKKEGYAVSLFGRRRPVPELSSQNFMQRSFGERVAMNSPIQGTAADIIKIAMIRVFERLKAEKMDAKLILQIHDELLIEAPEAEAEKAKAILIEEMQAAAELKVALVADCHIGGDWYEAK